METKNIIIANQAQSLIEATENIMSCVSKLADNADENIATIRTLNVLVESLRSQTVLMQGEIDDYN